MEPAKVWAEKVTIPTYEIGPAEKNPIFLDKRVYQGSSGKVYPYPTVESISDSKRDKAYTAVFLENEYLKIMVLPELGGRIQRALDKTNNYDFVYYNHVIKPALVGLTGPWISGGIEFNWPQHHRPTTFLPVDYTLLSGEDGSAAVLLHDVDQMYGTKGLMKIALYPGRAYMEITGQLYNRTCLPQTFLWWANPAVAVNDNTQSVFPPDVHAVMDHGKRDVSRFPIATGVYYKKDYSEGVDGMQSWRGLYGRTAGIVGMGNNGRTLATRLDALGMRLITYDKFPVKGMDFISKKLTASEGDTLEPLLAKSDFVILCVALTDETFHLINAETIGKMKDGAFLVNMARGGVVCTEDLVTALKSGKLGGAGLDVFETQPLEEDSPLWDLPNVYITPHSTPQVPDRAGRSIEIIRENARRFEAGEPLLNLMRPSDAIGDGKAEGGWTRMMNAKLTPEQIRAMDLEKYFGKRGWTNPSEWM